MTQQSSPKQASAVTARQKDRLKTPAPRASFIVRVSRDEAGRLSGIVERVQSGEKERFNGMESIGPLIARMAHQDGTGRRSP